jgi:2-dehydropantoate 2-reductase
MGDSRNSGSNTRSIAIIGAGALGSIFASALMKAGNAVTLLGRRPAPEITVCEPPCTIQGPPLTVETDPAVVANAEFVLVLVKTYDSVFAIRNIAPYLHTDSTLVTLQNGLGNAELIRKHVPTAQRVLAGVTSQAARRVSPGLILHTGVGPTLIGYTGETDHVAADCLAAALAGAGLPAAVTADIDRSIWQKVAINAAINGLTAVAGVPNGDLVSRVSLYDAAEALVEEAALVASAHGYDLGSIHHALRETISATAANRSSMLQDVDANRRTEVDAIYGSLIGAGRTKGLALPALTVIDALVRSVSGYDKGGEEST